MKKLILFFAVGGLMLSLHSCEKLSVSFNDVVIEQVLQVSNLTTKSASVLEVNESYNFDVNKTFSISDASEDDGDDDLSEYLESLNSVTVTSMDFTVIDVTPSNENSSVDSMMISISKGSVILYSESFTNITADVPFNAANLNSEVINSISDALLNKEELTLQAAGQASGDIQSFKIVTRIVSDIEANALDAAKTFF